jgi:hypothetical protein
VVLVGAILWFTDTNSGKGMKLVLSGILLAIVVEYFVLFPSSFVTVYEARLPQILWPQFISKKTNKFSRGFKQSSYSR